MAPSELNGVNGHANGETPSGRLDLKVIGLNCGTSVDGIDCVHVHYTQEHPDAPLKMELLNYDEGISPFYDGNGSADAVEIEEASHEGDSG